MINVGSNFDNIFKDNEELSLICDMFSALDTFGFDFNFSICKDETGSYESGINVRCCSDNEEEIEVEGFCRSNNIIDAVEGAISNIIEEYNKQDDDEEEEEISLEEQVKELNNTIEKQQAQLERLLNLVDFI